MPCSTKASRSLRSADVLGMYRAWLGGPRYQSTKFVCTWVPLPGAHTPAMSASCAFMLPVATAPNAAVYGTEEISIRRMVREGLVLNLIGVMIISIVATVLITGDRSS